MRKPILPAIVLLFLLTGLIAAAQGRKPLGQGDFTERFGETLQLTEEQQAEIRQLQDKLKADLQTIEQQSFEDPARRREAAHEKMKTHRAALESVLTDEQKAVLREKMDEHRQMRKDRSGREGLHKELKDYHEAQILPVLMQQRAKLESRISAEDKQTIAELRSAARNIREQKRETNDGGWREKKGTGKRELSDQQKEEMNRLKALVEKYEPEIESLFAEIKPRQEQWENDLRAIAEKHRPDNDGQIEKRSHRMDFPGRRIEGRAFTSKKHFLLMDPGAGTPGTGAVLPRSGAELKVFPNPATNSNRLQYAVRETGPVRIELRDSEGRLVRTLLDERRDPGDYSIDVDLSQLGDGIYYYSITDARGRTTQKVVVSNR